jgi:CheY-like chemotaxis protein
MTVPRATGLRAKVLPAPADHQPAAVLIVEDEMLIALATSSILSELGYEVTGIASSAEAAYQAAAARVPDLVLMDITLRGAVDGIEAGRVLKERFGVPILFVTAHSDGPTIDRAKTAGPIGYLIKPFSPKQLEQAVERAIEAAGRAS